MSKINKVIIIITMIRYDRGELLLGGPMAGYMWPEWNRPQLREVRLRRIHSGHCRLHDHHDWRATMQSLPGGDPRFHRTA